MPSQPNPPPRAKPSPKPSVKSSVKPSSRPASRPSTRDDTANRTEPSTTSRQSAPKLPPQQPALPRDRRVRLALRRLEPWSVFRFSLLFYLALVIVGVVALLVTWVVLAALGVFDAIDDVASVFNEGFSLSLLSVLGSYLLASLLGAVVWAVSTVLFTLLVNVISDLTGGIEVLLADVQDQASEPRGAYKGSRPV